MFTIKNLFYAHLQYQYFLHSLVFIQRHAKKQLNYELLFNVNTIKFNFHVDERLQLFEEHDQRS